MSRRLTNFRSAQFQQVWIDDPTDDQQTQQAKEKKVPPHPKRYKEKDYCTEDITVGSVTEVY